MARKKQVYTVAETAALLSVSSRTVWRLIARGTLHAVRIGRSVRIDRRVIEKFVATGGAR